MKNVGNQLKSFSVSIVVMLFAISVVFANPLSAMALTVNYTLSGSANADYQTYNYKLGEDNSIGTSLIAPSLEQTSENTQTGTSIEILAPGTKYATALYVIDSGKPGPVVMIVGGVHGNEPAGYTAATEIGDWEIRTGTLLVLPEANKLADDKKIRYLSSEGDLNRSFPKSSSQTPSNTLSKAIWNAMKTYDVDWLMDMHEGYDYYKNPSTSSVGQTLIYYPNKSTNAVSSKIISSLNQNITTSYKKFSLLQYPAKGSLARAAGQYLGIHSFIFETCDNPSLSVRVDYQLKAAKTLLQELDMM